MARENDHDLLIRQSEQLRQLSDSVRNLAELSTKVALLSARPDNSAEVAALRREFDELKLKVVGIGVALTTEEKASKRNWANWLGILGLIFAAAALLVSLLKH